MKDKIKNTWQEVSVAWKSFTQFVEASSLAIAAIYTGYSALHAIKADNAIWFDYLKLFAAVVIALRATHEYWKHFTRK